MKQITTTVEQFLSFFVGVALICFFSFILLLASAKLNDSLLGDLLARVAGETARTARTESFAYWGKVGNELADGLGIFQGGGTTIIRATPTAVVIVATQPPNPNPNPQPTSPPGPQPTATPSPTTYIRESALSKAGVYLWQGLDPSSFQPLPTGVDLEAVKSQVTAALAQNRGDLTAIWLQKRLELCYPAYQALTTGNRDQIYTQANILLACNPRAIIAYAARRWADIKALPTAQPIDSAFPIIWPSDETQAAKLLDGLTIGIGDKLDGTARGLQPGNHIAVTVLDNYNFGIGTINMVLTVSTLDQLLGGSDKWTLNSGPYTIGTSRLFPDPATLPPPNPAEPSEADLTPPSAPPPLDVPSGSAGGAEITTYIVQAGDTANSIARQFNITLEALVAANPTTLGVDVNLIYPGTVLNIPAP